MPERSKGSGCKPDGYAYAGSNPASPISRRALALVATLVAPARIAQLVEHFHGKEGVVGSSPTPGSVADASVLIRDQRGESEHVLDRELILGREETDVVLDDPGVSRRHAALRPEGDIVVVEDLGSSNGTFVNGERIDGPVEVGEGDEIQLGATEIEVRGAAAATNVMGAGASETDVYERPPARGPSDAAARVLRPTEDQNVPALIAMLLGAGSVILVLFGFGSATAFYIALPMGVAAIVFGSAGKRRVDRGESQRNRGLALAGQVFGVIGTILATLGIIAVIIVSTVLDAGADNIQDIIDSIDDEINGVNNNAGDLIDQGQDAGGGQDSGGVESP